MLNAELRLIYHAVMPLVIGGSSPTRPTHLIGSVGKLTSITGTTTSSKWRVPRLYITYYLHPLKLWNAQCRITTYLSRGYASSHWWEFTNTTNTSDRQCWEAYLHHGHHHNLYATCVQVFYQDERKSLVVSVRLTTDPVLKNNLTISKVTK